MPYLYFSTYHQNESGEEMTEDPSDVEKRIQAEINIRQELFNAYAKSVIHQPTTLDEFYYQFASDKNSVKDRNWRNKDQVVTKYLQGLDIKKKRFWPLLRVSQLWVWTIDENEFPGAFGNASVAIRGRKESRLFSLSYRRDNDSGELEASLDAEHTSKKKKALQNALEKVAKQLCDIKDIRDELNILKSIAAFQHKVQSNMAGNGAKEELSSYYLLRDIDELDKFADQTQEAVKTTLTLQESGIANWQASESFNQGKTVLVFTLVTVWFLPLSFLTSLFALDVEKFMETPA
ncbi:hypothetical protein NW754_000560 [Fusarium falciforme]|nr:hypothetical protein NW754_000560 [Fusarium falciforme]